MLVHDDADMCSSLMRMLTMHFTRGRLYDYVRKYLQFWMVRLGYTDATKGFAQCVFGESLNTLWTRTAQKRDARVICKYNSHSILRIWHRAHQSSTSFVFRVAPPDITKCIAAWWYNENNARRGVKDWFPQSQNEIAVYIVVGNSTAFNLHS